MIQNQSNLNSSNNKNNLNNNHNKNTSNHSINTSNHNKNNLNNNHNINNSISNTPNQPISNTPNQPISNNKLLKNPFTVNCKSCNLPLTDSFSLLTYKKSNLIFTNLSSIPIIEKKKNVENECIFNFIKCKCHLIVGKKFITTTVEMNGFSGMYFIDRDSVYTYMLGGNVNESDNNVPLSDLYDEIDKIQRLCLYLYKKIDERR